jgi:hypothetical protein
MVNDPALEDDADYAALTLTDYIEIVDDALDEAVDKLNEQEIGELCRAVRKKIDRIAADQTPAPELQQARDRWWDR